MHSTILHITHALPSARNDMASTTSPSPARPQSSQQEIGDEQTKISIHSSEDANLEKQQSELAAPQLNKTAQEPDKVLELASDSFPVEEQWVSGFKLFSIMTSVSLVAFLMLLDTAIIVTVGINLFQCRSELKNQHRLFLK
jgi:hypothetical protein